MKIIVLLLPFLISCGPMKCKTVIEIGGCNNDACGVRFSDGTYTSRALQPMNGFRMCELGSGYWAVR